MEINFKKIININNKKDLLKFKLDRPIYGNNYLFHYLIELGNLKALKLIKFPIYLENNDGLNGFHIAAKQYNYDILSYLIEKYKDYIYNNNENNEFFTHYLDEDKFIIVMEKYKKLDWNYLITNDILVNILINLKYNDLKKFISLYKINDSQKNIYLFAILKNSYINTNQKINLLNDFTNEEINIKNTSGEGLIFIAIEMGDYILLNYLLSRNIDYDYYSFGLTKNPLILSIILDIINDEYRFSKLLLDKIIKKNPLFYKNYDNHYNNIAHIIILTRINRNKQNKNESKTYPEINILKLCDHETWNQENIYKKSPLELITELDFDIYSNILLNNNIHINKNIKIDNKKWQNLFNKLPEYIEDKNSIILINNEYTHSTLFQATFKDLSIYILYLNEKYPDIYIPTFKSNLLNKLTFTGNFELSDYLIEKEPIFPWIISYFSSDEYFIHPYLNHLINSQKNKSYAFIMLSITTESILHANILIYDFKNKIIERFEPYGNTQFIDNNIDLVLEEELTWNTGFKYMAPKDYLPYAGFQTISDENNIYNKKSGDFGGFCLAWCLWYFESKLLNKNINSKLLVHKLINKLNKLDIKFIDYIRNYSNKINEYRVKYLEKIGIPITESSNTKLNIKNNLLITNFIIDKFNGKI